MKLTHLDKRGRARMVDVGSKPRVVREAIAEGRVWISPATMQAVQEAGLPKGNPFEVARVAGIQSAKRTAELIPLAPWLPPTTSTTRASRGKWFPPIW